MIKVQVRLDGRELERVLTRLIALGRDSSPVLRSMGTTLKSITEGNFNSVGAEFRPRPWPPKKTGEPSNLQQSTTLAKSFSLRVSPLSAVVSNPTVYAAIHQFGGIIRTRRAEIHMPARPFFPIEETGELTPKAEVLIENAGKRAITRLLPGGLS